MVSTDAENLLLQNGCGKSFKTHQLFCRKTKPKQRLSIFLFHVSVLHTEIVSLLMFHFCSSLFTMFEFTKLIYLWRCIFIHLYFYFCTMFFFFFFFWLPFVAFLVCNINMVTLLLLLLQLEKNALISCVWRFFFFFFKEVIICWSDPACVHRAELACGPTNQCIAVHVNNQDSIFKKAWVNIISCLRSLWSAFDHENPRKRNQGYVDINCDTELRVLHQNILPICSQLGYKS